jgi:ribulose-phosphate 3-epimerase
MARVVPSLTAETPEDYAAQIDRLKPFATRIHVDTADGVFVPRRLLGLSQVYDIENVPMDLHLMVSHPESQFEHIVSLQPSLAIIHFESEGDRGNLFRELRESGIKVGLAINVETTIEQVKDELPNIDHLLVFTGGHLGYYGGEFQTQVLEKIGQARAIKPDLEISVDGGVDQETARLAIEAGADVLTCGSFIQQADDPEIAYEAILAIAEGEA